MITRRDFLADGARIAGGAASLMALASSISLPTTAHAAKSVFAEPSCGKGGGKMNKTVLIAYASMSGSTGGVAEAIGRTLCDSGAMVDVRQIGNVRELGSYDAVVVGSAIRSDKWLSEAKKFVETNRHVLAGKPVAYFLTCLTLVNPAQGAHRQTLAFLDPVVNDVPEVQPVDIGLFAGKLDYSKLSWMVSLVMKQKMRDKGISEGDYRNWDAIRSWAEGLRSPLLRAEAKAS